MATKSTWNIDKAHSEISFKVKHMMISTVTGQFEDFEATAETDNDDFVNANFSFVAKTNSINTKNANRDGHLKSDDFFNAVEFPELSFKSTSFDGKTLVGQLTIRGITQEMKMKVDFNGIVVDPYGQTKAGFQATGSINRKDFNLTWGAVTEAGNVVVGDTVSLIVDLEFDKV